MNENLNLDLQHEEDPDSENYYYNPKYFCFVDSDAQFTKEVGTSGIRLSKFSSVYSFNPPPKYILRFEYGLSFSDEETLVELGIEESLVTHYLEKYPYILCREPIYGLKDENQRFIKVLLEYHKSDSYKTPKDIEEAEKNERMITTRQLLNFHLFAFQGYPKDFTDHLKIMIEGMESETFSGIQLKRKVNRWISEIEESLKQPTIPEPLSEHEEGTAKTNLRLQMLTIHYLQQLGHINPDFHDKLNVASIFSVLLGRSAQNIRTKLGHSQPEFLESDLKTLIPLFEKLGQKADEVVKNMKMNLTSAELDPNNNAKKLKTLNTNNL